MRINTKRALSFFLVLAVLVSSMSMLLSVWAAGSGVSLELNGGTLNGSSDYNAGDILPNYEKLTKQGAVFGGWYTDPNFTGTQVFAVPAEASGKTVYYARWMTVDANFDNFNSYKTDTELLSEYHWNDWQWPATTSVTTLNTDSAHSYSGNSMKVCLNVAGKNTELVVAKADYPKTGSGIAFWIKTTGGATVKLKFNNSKSEKLHSKERVIPAGKHFAVIPWSEIEDALNSAYLWQTSLVISVPDADSEVYIDEMGTYTDYTESSVSFETNGGSWKKGYNPPETYSTGMVLPTADNIERDGLCFAGWYTDAEFTGTNDYTVPDTVTGDVTYYARWMTVNANFDNFNSYKTDAELLSEYHWNDWKWPATTSVTTLNTDSAHSYSGNSMKVCLNVAGKNTELVVTKADYPKTGSGIAFWIETTGGATVKLKFNNSKSEKLHSKERVIPAGKHFAVIPWSEIEDALNSAYLWQTSLVISVPDADSEVYIDEMGTYTDYTEGSVVFAVNGGSWEKGYNPPKKYIPGMVLPTMDNIKKNGAVFAGWYDNAGFTGNRYYVVPDTVSGDITYYARWIKTDSSFSDFEGFTDTGVVTSVLTEDKKNTANDKTNDFITEEEGKGGFYYWSGVAGSTVGLNTAEKYANSGSKSAKLVLKVKDASSPYNSTQFGSDRVYFPNNKDLGEGIAFWINTDREIKFDVQLNQNTASAKITVPAGKHFVTIPWEELQNKKSPWSTLIRFENPKEETTVYIDDIGTYSVAFDYNVTFNMNGGEGADGYVVPSGYNTLTGLYLPDTADVKYNGLAFTGWYDNAALTGSPVYSIAAGATGNKEYWAKWIVHDVNFDGFDSYDTDADMMNDNHWSDWKYPAALSVTSLNTNSSHAHNSGKSMKIMPNEANKNGQLVVARVNYPKSGDGIAFWVESTGNAALKVVFNGKLSSDSISISAGKRIVTVPWAEIGGAADAEFLWQTSFLVSVSESSDAVYIDEIGTYTEDIGSASTVDYYTLGGSWTNNYNASAKYSSAGVKLPTYENIKKDGYIFAGWYDNKECSGAPLYVTPESGSLKLYAKWIKSDAVYENFESCTDSSDWNPWSESGTPTLSTAAENASGGSKSLKISVANKQTYNQVYATLCKNGSYAKSGDGVYFWVKSEIATDLLFAFDNQNKTYTVSVPAGKSFVTVPWNDFTALPEWDKYTSMFIRIPTPTGNGVTNTVYIDDIGTYSDSTDRILTYNLNGGNFVAGAEIATELDGANDTVLPTDSQVQKDGFFFAGWYTDAEFTGTPIFGLKPNNTANREFWAKWVEQVNINHDFENFDSDGAVAKAEWAETTPYENWRESGSVYLYLEKDSKNLAPGSTKGLRAEYEVLDGEYIKSGAKPSACFRNYSWSTTFGKRGTDREGDGFKFWIKTDRTITLRVGFLIGGDPKKGTTSQDLIIPANDSGVTVYLPWSYIKETDAKTLASMGFTIYDSVGTKGTVWIDELGIYYNEKMVDFVAENNEKDIKITGYNNHIPKKTTVEIKKYRENTLSSLGGKLPSGVSMAYLAEYKLLNESGGAATLYGPAWISFKRPAGTDTKKIGVYEVFFDGSLDAMNYTVEGDWITVYSLNPTAMLLVTTNDTNWSAKGITVDADVIQKLTVTTTVTKSVTDRSENTVTDTDNNLPANTDINTDENDKSQSVKRGPKRTSKRQPSSSGTDTQEDNTALITVLICACAAAIVIAGTVIVILIKRKRGKNNGGAK